MYATPCCHLLLPPAPSTQLTGRANFQLKLPERHLAVPANTQTDPQAGARTDTNLDLQL